MPNESRVLTLPAAAEYLSTTERHMRRLVSERRIAFTRVGRFLRFRVEDLESYLSDNRVTPHASSGRSLGRQK